MIRFSNGTPQALWYSQHAGGEAFTYEATEKQGKRPVAYSAKGTHAVYAIAGSVPPHPYTNTHSLVLYSMLTSQRPRPHNPPPQPPRRLCSRSHRPGHPLGSDTQRIRIRLRPRDADVHAVRQPRQPHASQLALLQRPVGRPRAPRRTGDLWRGQVRGWAEWAQV